MKITSDVFKQEKNKLTNQPIHLYTVHDYDGAGTNLLLAEYPENVTFNGIEYVSFPITFDSIKENSKGQIDSTTLKVSNVMRVFGGYFEIYDFRGKKVTVKTVWANLLADTTSYIDDIYYIDSYSADQVNVSFTLTTKFNVLAISLPLRSYSRNYCSWLFKGTECAYAGEETTCNKTKQQCKEYSNYSRFGGFPSIQPKRAVLA
jgi:lambda family phage minor tail protein L